MAQPRLVLVDDTNSNIQYSGPWFLAQNTQPNIGDFGPPFENTLHGVNEDASFSYSFSGSLVTVLGTSITTNISGTQDPTWECFVDNNSIGWNTVLEYAENNWVFCQDTQLQDGPHVLTLNAKVSNQQTFWFDQIRYLPSAGVSLDEAILRIDSSDPAVQYSSGWSRLDGIADVTQTSGSTITFVFSGVSLSFVGFLPENFPLTVSTATYSIDGQTPISFFVPTGARQLYNQVLFQTGQLSTGQHKLVVTHQGNSGTAPLALNYFVVQGAPSSFNSSNTPPPSSSSSSSSSSSPGSTVNSTRSATGTTGTTGTSTGLNTASSGIPTTAGATATSIITSGVPSSSSFGSTSYPGSATSSTLTKSSRSLGAIIGGALGGLVLLLLLLILFLLLRRRHNQRGLRLNEKSLPDASLETVNPFTLPPSHSIPSYTSNGQPPTPQLINNKFAQERLTNDMNSTSNMRTTLSSTNATNSVSGGRLPVLAPLRYHFSSLTTASPSSPSTTLSTTRTNFVDSPVAKTGTGQRLVSPQGGDGGFFRHEDSGIRVPEDNSVVELPPLYTLG